MLYFDPTEDAHAQTALRELWEKLVHAGGIELMPLGEYPFSPLYAWVEDQFGVSWQLLITPADTAPRPFVVPSFLFGGPAQNKAKPAIEKYLGAFEGSSLGNLVPWGQTMGPATQDSVLFADFKLADQWFTAMDSGAETEFTFTPGVSLCVNCQSHEEATRIHQALDTHVLSDQSGSIVDEFGVTWRTLLAMD
ncbi:VOC family protein [Corynebacterium freiburgense]